ncbi:RNA polymerase sigma-70 factor [Pedobacter nyackensis]|uniref:RNA polymerase sigma-70 factor, ECF subfamily n=1 Tax=Pedobacter nyackensis TaxID=475255 RepID=A0A1W2D3B6_9SPHI|nr:RNA polymerase sigma-70 factor [Pedobacter nyackensis]SMC91921.1 RNA polymerase sigma-70 factor, ECF subfamily [Pedobacter nyackensis]
MEILKQSFAQLFKNYHHRSVLFAKSFVRLDEVAEDIASDALCILWERMKKEEVLSVKSFLFRVIKNKSLDYLKHQKVTRKVIESIEDWESRDLQLRIDTLESMHEDEMLTKEITEIAHRTLQALPEKTRQVFLMSRQENLSGKEIAQQLDISVKGVEYHMSKALKVLSVNLKDYLSVFLFFF